jgi:chromosome segregation ATPase
MKRFFAWLNLLGVLALAALCVAQWRENRGLNVDVIRLREVVRVRESKLEEQADAARGLSQDLARLKHQFQDEHDALEAASGKVIGLDAKIAALSAERDQLGESVTNWARAVAQRDASAREANERIRILSNELNASIEKFNALVTNFNSVASDLNAERKRAPASNTQ